jgi:hypothetical protein
MAQREAARTLENVVAQARVPESAVVAELTMTQQLVVGAILAQGQRVLSTLAADAAAETGATQSRLTALGSAERISHVTRRSEAYPAIDVRVQRSDVSESDAAALRALADADLATDVEATNGRIRRSKEFVELLHLGFLSAPMEHEADTCIAQLKARRRSLKAAQFTETIIRQQLAPFSTRTNLSNVVRTELAKYYEIAQKAVAAAERSSAMTALAEAQKTLNERIGAAARADDENITFGSRLVQDDLLETSWAARRLFIGIILLLQLIGWSPLILKWLIGPSTVGLRIAFDHNLAAARYHALERDAHHADKRSPCIYFTIIARIMLYEVHQHSILPRLMRGHHRQSRRIKHGRTVTFSQPPAAVPLEATMITNSHERREP